jgi:O-antigen/teichoic acid export membrane protein
MISNPLSRIRKNFSFLLTAEVAIRAMMLILTIFLAQAYGPEKFGVYALALSIGNLFEIIFNLGLGTVFMQRVSGNPGEMQDQLKLFLPLRIILSLAGFAVFVIFAAALQKPPETFLTLVLAGLYFSLFSVEMFMWNCFDARQKMHFTAATKFLQYGIIFALGLYFILVKSPIHFLLLAYLAGVLVAGVSTILLIGRYFSRIGWHADFGKWKHIIAEGWPIALSGAFIFIYNSLDTIIISVIRGEEAVGLYQISYKIIGTIFLLAALVNQAYLPSLIESAAKNKSATADMLGQAVQSMFFWSLPVTFGGLMLADRIVVFIFGPDYVAGIPAFRILIWNCIIYFLSSAMTNLLYAAKKQKSAMKIFFLGALANVAFNIFMIPLYGIEGAALTTVLAELVVLAGIYSLTRKIAPARLLGNLWRPLIAATIMAGSLIFIRIESLLLTIGIGGLIYFGMYFLLSKMRLKNEPAAVHSLPHADY